MRSASAAACPTTASGLPEGYSKIERTATWDYLQAFIDEYSSPLKDLGHIHTACYMRDILEVGRETPDLSGVGFPVLVIGASSGTFTDAGRMQEWVRSLRDGSWAVVNCFHWPLTECPEEVSRIIEEWIGREFRG